MRIPVLVGFALFAAIGNAIAASPANGEWNFMPSFTRPHAALDMGTVSVPDGVATYVKTANDDGRQRSGGIQQIIPLDGWGGKRLRVSLRLKNEGDARAYAFVQVNKANNTAIRTIAQQNSGDGAWQDHQFVLDVPANHTWLVVAIGFNGKGNGGSWVNGVTLSAADADAPVSKSLRLEVPVILPPSLPEPAQFYGRNDSRYGLECMGGSCSSNGGYEPPTSKAWSDPPPRR